MTDKAMEIAKEAYDLSYAMAHEPIEKIYERIADLIRPHLKQEFGEWQTCPVCGGQGTVEKPPGVDGDVEMWMSSGGGSPCKVCGGAGIIQRPEAPNE